MDLFNCNIHIACTVAVMVKTAVRFMMIEKGLVVVQEQICPGGVGKTRPHYCYCNAIAMYYRLLIALTIICIFRLVICICCWIHWKFKKVDLGINTSLLEELRRRTELDVISTNSKTNAVRTTSFIEPREPSAHKRYTPPPYSEVKETAEKPLPPYPVTYSS